MRCCDKDRDSAYCPECGEQLAESNELASLLTHLERQVEKYRRGARRARSNGGDEDWMNSRDELVNKWVGWLDLVQDLAHFKRVANS